MDKMELAELIVNRMLQVQLVSNHKQSIIDSILELFTFNCNLRWALREYREKREEWLKKEIQVKASGMWCSWVGNIIDQALELTEKEEKKIEEYYKQGLFLKSNKPGIKIINITEPKEEKKYCECKKPTKYTEWGGCIYCNREVQEITIPKELTLHDCDWNWAQKEVINTINDCVKAIREIREK